MEAGPPIYVLLTIQSYLIIFLKMPMLLPDENLTQIITYQGSESLFMAPDCSLPFLPSPSSHLS